MIIRGYYYRKSVFKIEIDSALIKQALELSQLKTKKEVVHQALEHYVKRLKQLKILSMQGQVKWEGNLDEMRPS